MNSADQVAYDPFNSRTDNAEQVELLVRSIRYAEEFALFFAVCNQNGLRERLLRDLRAQLSDLKVDDFPVWKPVRNLYRSLRDRYPEGAPKPDVVMVYGIEAWLPSGVEGENSPFVRNLNAARDHLPLVLKGPMVLWLPEHALKSIAAGAPDFCSVRSGIFTFSSTSEERQGMEGILQTMGLEGVAGLSYEEKESRAAQLMEMLEEVDRQSAEERDTKRERRLLRSAAETFYTMGRYDKAEPLLRRLLAMDEASYGPDHPEVARDLNNLAVLLQATNRLSEAEPLMRRALEIDEASYGPDHPNVARDLNNLAQLLQATDRLSEAEPLMRRALEIDEASFGSDHPDVARDLNNLALLLNATNRLSEAEPLMRRALTIDEASLGPDHPNVGRDLGNLGSLLQAGGKPDEGKKLLERALSIFEKRFDANHPHVQWAKRRLATFEEK